MIYENGDKAGKMGRKNIVTIFFRRYRRSAENRTDIRPGISFLFVLVSMEESLPNLSRLAGSIHSGTLLSLSALFSFLVEK